MATRFPNNFVWDGGSDGPAEESGHCIRIRADREQLDLIAGFLLGTLGLRYPDEQAEYDTDKPLSNLNRPLLNAARHIGLQLLRDGLPCEEFDTMPIFRMNPENSCQMQQSTNGGLSWTTVLDTSACQPTIPPMIQLRQHPTQRNLLLQSHDNGVTWTTAYNYALYRPPSGNSVGDVMYITNISQDTLTTIVNTYNDNSQTVISIAPDLVYDSTEDDDIRDVLVCWACREIVKIMCEAEIANRNVQAIGAAVGSAVLAIVGALIDAGIIVVSGGSGTPLAIAVASALTGVAGALWAGVSTDVLSNEGAREDVACCMYNALKGASPERTAFLASLDGCEFAPGSMQAQLSGAIAGQLSQPDMHAAWLNYAQENYRAAELGLLSDCPCDEEEPIEITDWVYLRSDTYNPRSGTVEYLGSGRYRATTWNGEGDHNFVLARGAAGPGGPFTPFNVGNIVIISGIAPGGGGAPTNPTETWYMAWPSGDGPQTVEFDASPA